MTTSSISAVQDLTPGAPRTLSNLITTETRPAELVKISGRVEKLQFMLEQLRDLKEQSDTMKREPDTATTFPLFPKLPVELRLKVFYEVLYTQEIFAIGWETLTERERNSEEPRGISGGEDSSRIRSAEARNEALKVLQVFELHGERTWFNTAVDVAWLPKFDLSTGEMTDEGFLVDHKLQRVTLRYKSWIEPDYFEVTNSTYRLFGEKGLHELILTLGIKDLSPASDHKTVTADRQPRDFSGTVVRLLDLNEEYTWRLMEEVEMEKMTIWNECHQPKSVTRAWAIEELNKDPDTVDDITVPSIRFRLEIGTSFLLIDGIYDWRIGSCLISKIC
ncbi:hypothetical protein BKA64DRAFT_712203 [Cadophora sp. MPI-SDFR-AT-0126]|nr:hypothetical protein BKA64DRAFT_712203 [Leotiomycetes sp. MPI-SDFR-AT-0126]